MSTYTLDSLGGACPTQAEGTTAEGRHFYFRARHGSWTLRVYQDEFKVDGSEIIASGDDPTGGCMGNDEVLAILDKYFNTNYTARALVDAWRAKADDNRFNISYRIILSECADQLEKALDQ